MARRLLPALGAIAVGMPASCSDSSDKEPVEPVFVVGEALGSEIAEAPNLTVLSGVLGDTGLMQMLNGVGSYTILAPEDAVFDRLGDGGAWLRQPEQRPIMAAILREHILPGYLTPEDIDAALDSSGSVEMQTMADHRLTFSQNGDGIRITGEDGATAHVSGAALRGSNGIAIPVNGLLKQVPPME